MFLTGNAMADEVALHFSNSKLHCILAFESPSLFLKDPRLSFNPRTLKGEGWGGGGCMLP